MQVTVNKLEADIEEAKREKAEPMKEMQDDLVEDDYEQPAPVPTKPRSAAIPVTDPRATTSAPPTAPSVPAPAPVSTPPAPQTSAEAFADGLLSMPSTHTEATRQKTPSGAPGDRA